MANKRIKELPGWAENADLTGLGVYYSVSTEGIGDILEKWGYILDGDGDLYAAMSALDIERLGIPYGNICPGSWEFDALDYGDSLAQLIHEAGAYLVFARGCRWNGASGYSIVRDPERLFYRDYDACITPLRVLHGGKVLACRESSHDVPMGSDTYVIALTERQARRLENASFAQVERFALEWAGQEALSGAAQG